MSECDPCKRRQEAMNRAVPKSGDLLKKILDFWGIKGKAKNHGQ